MLDLNVLLDVIQNRAPHYPASAGVLSAARSGQFEAVIPAHAITTIFYLIERANGRQTANQSVDWLRQHFEIPATDRTIFLRARALSFGDFEDAVVAAIAESRLCEYIVSRNSQDFAGSPVKTVSPEDFLGLLQV